MITVKQFRDTHNLTDRRWRDMKDRIKKEHPGLEFTVREGNEFFVSDDALPIFEGYLPKQKSSGAIVPVIDVEIVEDTQSYRPISNSKLATYNGHVHQNSIDLRTINLEVESYFDINTQRSEAVRQANAAMDSQIQAMRWQLAQIEAQDEMAMKELAKQELELRQKHAEIEALKGKLQARINASNQALED